VTDDDKTNLLVATQAKAAGCPITISLINDPNMTGLMEPLGISAFVNPRATTVSSILRHIRHGRVRRVYSIGDGEAEVIEAQVLSSSPIAGKEIKEIDFPEGVIVGGIKKGNEVIKPVGNTTIQQGDVITIFSLAREVPNVEALLQVSIDFF
jgi:trk system potassium uptake protein TrkA